MTTASIALFLLLTLLSDVALLGLRRDQQLWLSFLVQVLCWWCRLTVVVWHRQRAWQEQVLVVLG